MSLRIFHRHDRVWLEAGFDARASICAAGVGDAACAWIACGRPLVVARQDDVAPEFLRLGITFPGSGARQRATVVAPKHAVVAHEPAELLCDAMVLGPAAWKPRMLDLLGVCARKGVQAHIYGSLSREIESGETYLNADSDLDVLFACEAGSDVCGLLRALRNLDGGVPRIDGEVLLPSGWAVAWRELAAALLDRSCDRVLAKSDQAACVIPMAQLRAEADLHYSLMA